MRVAAVAVVALALFGGGCAGWFARQEPQPLHPDNPPGRWHLVAQGETLKQIAAEAGVPMQDLMELNGISDPKSIGEGQYVYVLSPDEPGGPSGPGAPEPGHGTGTGRDGTSANSGGPAGPASDPTKPRFLWPLAVPMISSPYGVRGKKVHEGIDLAAPAGTPVLAADDGEVVYSGDKIAGYGNMVVVSHPGGLLTVYAHNSAVLAKTGDRVTRGQTLARVGQSGRATGPHLHFEVRQGDVPRDPVLYLPALSRSPGGK